MLIDSSYFNARDRVWVAFSGGVDSTVLLSLLASRPNVSAIHVNHRLHPEANQWQAHCEQVAASLGVPLVVEKITLQGCGNVEATARCLRYQAIEKHLGPGDVLVTAHHQGDQAETFLLQGLRGAGVRGLAAMPIKKQCSFKEQHGTYWHIRPLLNTPRAEIMAYAETQSTWVEDPSNTSCEFDRNFIRHEVLPKLSSRWRQAPRAFARAAQHLQEADELLLDLAELDKSYVVLAVSPRHIVLSARRMKEFSLARQKNLVRSVCHQLQFGLPSEKKMSHVINDVVRSPRDKMPCVSWGQWESRRFRDHVFLQHQLPAHDPRQVIPWCYGEALALGNGAVDVLDIDCFQGNVLKEAAYELRFRTGGEKIRLPGRAGSHSLKKLFQEWGVPTWLRDRVPLLYCDGVLVAVYQLPVSW